MDSTEDLSALRIERAPRRASRRWVRWVVLLVLLAGAGGTAWTWMTRERPVEVEVASVTTRRAGAQASVLNASGYVTARRRATVSSKVTGKIVEVNVEEGMAVREGQVLARLDDANVRAALRLMEAQLEAARRAIAETEVRLAEAERTLKRRERLRTDGLITDADLDQARSEVQSLEARIAASQEQVTVAERQVALQQTELDNMVIRAPFSGVALSKDAQPGEMVSPVSAGGGFTRTGISHHRGHEVARNRGGRQRELHQPRRVRTARHGAAGRVSRLADSRPRDHHRADGGSTESDGVGPHRLRPAGSANSARHGRQGHLPPRGRRRRGRARADRPRAQGGGPHCRTEPATCSWCGAMPSSAVRFKPPGPMATGSKCQPGCRPATAS